jgi:heme exporter protein B
MSDARGSRSRHLPSYGAVFWAVLSKDIRTELRSKETLATMGLFGAVMTFVLAFGFVSDPEANRRVLPGALWTALLFVGTLGVGRTFAREARDDAFTALVLSPGNRSAILLAKMTGNLLLSLLILSLVAPLLVLMLHVDLGDEVLPVAASLALGAVGFSVVGTPLAVMAVNARFAEVLLPMVVFPLVSPVLISGVTVTGVLLGTNIGGEPLGYLQLMLAFNLAFGLVGLFLFEKMVTE